ncbi:MAG: C4-dicarboxylate ABC transporter permease [Chloroflexi bacterium RBG_16_60_22]|nr:MAG: C4-dicarboxylate ABC transporter permease [Chloroflexi bacterium RBG_16_60_22]
MSPEMIGFIGIVALVVLIFLRLWIGAVMVLIGFVGYGVLAGWNSAFVVAGTEPYSNIAFYPITVIPLFILMGAVVSNTGVSGDLFDTANKWVGKTRGGLAMATVIATAMFSAICGSSAATAATMGRVALPQMKRHNYDDRMATGCVAAGGTMGILIPPSMGFILYGILTETSIGKLFMAGIIPGILEAVFYMITIWIMCKWKPAMGPPGEASTLKQKIFALKGTWAMFVLFILVMGGIYMGVFTPTEAGAIGAFGAILISFVSRRLTWHNMRGSVVETAQTTAMIVFMIVGAFILMRFLAISKLPFFIGELVAGLPVPPMMILVAIIIMYIILGCFLDVFAAIILTIPIIFPAVLAMGFDTIWFGVIMVRIMEIGLITPPFGMNVFIMSTVTDVPIGQIFRGVIPFVIADFAHVALLVAVPWLSLFLPNSM